MMWRLSKGLLAASTAGVLSYNIYKYSQILKTDSFISNNPEFLLYTPNTKHDLNSVLESSQVPYLIPNQWFDPSSYNLGLQKSSTGLHYIQKLDSTFHSNPLEVSDKFSKWLNFHQNPYQTVATRQELRKLLKLRKKSEFLDSFVVAYVPLGNAEREKTLKELIVNIRFEDPASCVMGSYGMKYINFFKVTDEGLAKELKIDNLDEMTFLRIRDCRGWFHANRPRSDYVKPEVLKNYIEDQLSNEFKINGHELQMDLQIYFDRFILSKQANSQPGYFTEIKSLATAVASIDPAIIPLFTLKQLQLVSPRIFFSTQAENSKMLLISIKKDHEERNLNEIQSIFQGFKLEEFNRKHPEILIVVGYPEFIYHMPIKDIAVYHYENVEVRLIDIKGGQAVNSVFLAEDMQLSDLLEVKEKHMESSPPSVKQNAEIFTPDQFYNKVLSNNDRCFFVMNCSKTCPACSYQDIFFQEAAKSAKDCQFIKYYVSNQSPYYKGPGSTPRYHLYLPGKSEPLVYEPKEHGLKPENFLEFVSRNLQTN